MYVGDRERTRPFTSSLSKCPWWLQLQQAKAWSRALQPGSSTCVSGMQVHEPSPAALSDAHEQGAGGESRAGTWKLGHSVTGCYSCGRLGLSSRLLAQPLPALPSCISLPLAVASIWKVSQPLYFVSQINNNNSNKSILGCQYSNI